MIIGEMSNGMMTERHGKLERDSPSAASVPSTVAISVAIAPMPRLLRKARCQSGLSSAFSYQRSEKPVIGYEKYEPALNDSGMIASTGAIRKASTMPVCQLVQTSANRVDSGRLSALLVAAMDASLTRNASGRCRPAG